MKNSVIKLATKKSIVVILSVIYLVCNSTVTFAQRANFSGNWVINIEKSEFGKAPLYTVSKELKIEQKEDSLNIVAYSTNQIGEDNPPALTKYKLDGKPTSKITEDKRKMITTIQWSGNSRIFTKTSHFSLPNNESQEDYIRTDIWQLSDDGKTLIIERNVESKGGKYFIKAIYDKKVM